MKKLLLLGGLKYLLPVIERAKEIGIYVITCDYVPENIAHKYSDEYHNVSITDKEAVLNLARKLDVDGIMSFAVDPGVITAAYVSHKLGLPSPGPLKSIEILQDKGRFRNFLKKNNFNVPNVGVYSDLETGLKEYNFNFPVIIKPVDSAGSKGVSKVSDKKDLRNAILYALKESRAKQYIIEDYIEALGSPSDSDCFSIEGNLEFITFSNQKFDRSSPNVYAPAGFTWPSSMSAYQQNYLTAELKRLIRLLDMNTSLYNVEVRIGTDDKPYIMEVAPRGGGNRLAEMVQLATGVDLISYSVKAALGYDLPRLTAPKYQLNIGQSILHSNKSGIFKELIINQSIQNHIHEVDLWVQPGEQVNAFMAANDSIGTIVFSFTEQKNLEEALINLNKYIEVVVE